MSKCSVCANPGLRKVIDGNLEDGVTGTGVSRSLASLGLNVSADIVNSHRQHYKPEPERAKGERKRDFAVYMRDRVTTAFENVLPETLDDGTLGPDPILHNKFAPAINVGLKAQAILDKREQTQKRHTQSEALVALLSALRGEGRPIALIDDPMVIDGTAVVLADRG